MSRKRRRLPAAPSGGGRRPPGAPPAGGGRRAPGSGPAGSGPAGGGRRPAPRPAPRRRPAVLAAMAAAGVAAAVLLGVGVVLALRSGAGRAAPGQAAASPARGTGTAAALRAASGQTVDGIQCQTQEQVLFHIHAHLAIYANGQPRTVPLGIGIPDAQTQATPDGPFVVTGSCFYWLHSHTADGVIHVESPVQRTYTLGNWFDIWGQPLSASQVGSDTGTVTAYLNGQRYTGDPRSIPLQAHGVIQLDVGTDVPPRPYTFASGL